MIPKKSNNPFFSEKAEKEINLHSKISQKQVSNIEYGKLPPQATDLEETVLGAIMLEKHAITLVLDIIKKPEVFYKDNHRKIFEAILQLESDGTPIDILTVTNKLKAIGTLDIIGGPYAIAQLTSRVGSAANVEYHSHILVEKHIKREVIMYASQNTNEAFLEETDVFELLDRVEERQRALTDQLIGSVQSNSITMYTNFIGKMEKILSGQKKLSGISTGFSCLDSKTNGLHPGHHYVVAARPGMGKTGFALSLLRSICTRQKLAAGFISLEMPEDEIVARQVSFETDLENNQLQSINAPENVMQMIHESAALYEKQGSSLLHINDSGSMKFNQLRAIAKRWKNKFDIQVLVVDYLQEVTYESNRAMTHTEEIGRIAKGLKALAKELKIPVISLSQLNRKVEEAPMKRPTLQHLKESGGIEESADAVWFLYRPEYYRNQGDSGYDFMYKNGKETDIGCEGKAEVITAKNRHGATGSDIVNFQNHTTLFYEHDKSYSLRLESQSVTSDVEEATYSKSIYKMNQKTITPDDTIPF